MASKNIINETKKFNEYKKMAIKYNDLKKSWSNIQNQKELINKAIVSSGVKNANIELKNNTIKVKIKNISIKKLNKLVNKILNKKLNIVRFYFNNNSLEIEVR